MLANPTIAVSVVRCDTNRFSYSCAAWRSFLIGVPMLRGNQCFHFCNTSAVKLYVFASCFGIGFPCCVALVFFWRPHAAWESIFPFLQHLWSETACFLAAGWQRPCGLQIINKSCLCSMGVVQNRKAIGQVARQAAGCQLSCVFSSSRQNLEAR